MHPSRIRNLGEVAVVFGLPLAVLLTLQPLADGLVATQALAWSVNILALLLVWGGLRWRRDTWDSLGIRVAPVSLRSAGRALATAFVVLLVALAAFVLGSIVGGMVFGIPESSDLGTYDYLRGNLPMLLLALTGAWIASSFGEEVLYRGFLITRLAEIIPGRARNALAVLLSGVVFGAIHYGWGPVGMVQTAFMGWALGAAWIKVGRNLWITILAHAAMDTVLLIQQYMAA